MSRLSTLPIVCLMAMSLLAAPAQAVGHPATSAVRPVTGDQDPSARACGALVRKPDRTYWTCRFVESVAIF